MISQYVESLKNNNNNNNNNLTHKLVTARGSWRLGVDKMGEGGQMYKLPVTD